MVYHHQGSGDEVNDEAAGRVAGHRAGRNGKAARRQGAE